MRAAASEKAGVEVTMARMTLLLAVLAALAAAVLVSGQGAHHAVWLGVASGHRSCTVC